ncbi:MAG: hypothetical protein U0350_09500 [Caldilineaceae bacterium]
MRYKFFHILLLLSLLWSNSYLLGIEPSKGIVHAAPDAPNAQPTQIISDTLDWWAMGNGLFYWSQQCVSSSIEFAYPVSIKRRPINVNAKKTLYTEANQHCRTFANLVSGSDGVYYYDIDQTRIARVASSQPYTPTTVLATTQAPNSTEALRLSDGFLYWPANTNKILRVRTDGTGFATVADATTNPQSLLVAGSTVLWTDNSGVWSIATNCATLPCTSTKQKVASLSAAATATGLLFHATGLFTYEYFWVENNNQIRHVGCSVLSGICAASTLFHAADTGWSIGELALDGTNLYWPEVFGQPSQTDGRLLRQAFSGGAAQLFVEKQIDLMCNF